MDIVLRATDECPCQFPPPQRIVLLGRRPKPLKKGKAFFVVSHRRMGKTEILTALSGGTLARRILIDGTRFPVRRMSNDEDDEGFFDLLEYKYPDSQPHIILAMCPTFKEDRRRLPLIAALERFSQRYELFFFVLGGKENPRQKRMRQHEVEVMKAFGVVEVFRRSAEAAGRARGFRKFIQAHM